MNQNSQENTTKSLAKSCHSLITQVLPLLLRDFCIFQVLAFITIFSLIIIYAPFQEVLREDAYLYLRKAFEITEGNWTPRHERLIGWSIFLAVFIKLLGIKTIFQGMLFSRILSGLCMSLTVFPLAQLTKNLAGKKAGMLSILAFTFSPRIIRSGGSGMTESLFILLVVSSIYFLTRSKSRQDLTLATFLASFSYYIRPNGVFLLPVFFIYILYTRRKEKFFLSIVIFFLFFLASSPHLILRYQSYGSAFDYGVNSKYFADSLVEISSNESASNYLSTFNPVKYYDKLFVNGFLKALKMMPRTLLWIWFLPFLLGSIRYLLIKRDKNLDIVYIIFLVFLAGYSVVFDIYGTHRHLFVLIPFAYIVSSKFIIEILTSQFKHNSRQALFLFIVFFLIFISIFGWFKITQSRIDLKDRLDFSTPRVRDQWALWAAENLQGNVAIIEGGDLITLALPNPLEKNPQIYTFRPLYYENLEQGIEYLEANDTQYLLLDSHNIDRRPYLKQVYSDKWSEHFVLIESFEEDEDDLWVIENMDIFKIVY